MFEHNIKTRHAPDDEIEDFYIEMLIQELAAEGRIDYRPAARNLKMDQVKKHWKNKLGDSGFYPEEN